MIARQIINIIFISSGPKYTEIFYSEDTFCDDISSIFNLPPITFIRVFLIVIGFSMYALMYWLQLIEWWAIRHVIET